MSRTVIANQREWKVLQAKTAAAREWAVHPEGRASMPHTVCVSVNNTCFMRCKMCDVGQANRDKTLRKEKRFFLNRVTGGQSAQELPLETLQRLVDDLAPHGSVVRVNFLEPLLRHDILDFAEYVISRGLPFSLLTNGYLLPRKAADIVRLGTHSIRVSLDGPPEVHDRIRGQVHSFQRAVEGLQQAVEARRVLGGDYPLIGVCFTISDHNHGSLLDFYRELHAVGLADEVYVAFNHLKYNTDQEALVQKSLVEGVLPPTQSSLGEVDPVRIDAKLLWEQIKQLRREFPEDRFKYHFNPLLHQDDLTLWYDSKTYLYPDIVCQAPLAVAQVFFDGEVGINGRCFSPTFGNIRNQSFPEIWNSTEACSFRLFLRNNKVIPWCNRCSRHFHG